MSSRESKMEECRDSENIDFCNTFAADKNSFRQAKPWGSSSFFIKDIVRDELHQAPLTPVDDFKLAMLQDETAERRGDNNALGQAKPSVVDELTVPLQTLPETKEQSSLVLVEPGESSWHVQVDDNYMAQFKQKLNEEVLGQWADEKSKEELMKLCYGKGMISLFGEGSERRSPLVSPSEFKHEFFQKDTIEKVRACRKEAEENLPLITHIKEAPDRPFNKKCFHWENICGRRAQPLQQQKTEFNEHKSPLTAPTFIKEKAGTSQKKYTLTIKPQKQQKDFIRSGREDFESSENTVLNGDAGHISVPNRKTETGTGSQETKDSGDPGEEIEALGSLPRKVKYRSSFSVEQIYLLEMTFERQKYLGTKEREQLAQRLGLSDTQVKTWFQNRRMKMKRKRAEITKINAQLAYLDTVASNVHRSPPCYHSNYLDHTPTSVGVLSPSYLMPSRPLDVFFHQPVITSPQYGCPWVDSRALYPSLGHGRISPPMCTEYVRFPSTTSGPS